MKKISVFNTLYFDWRYSRYILCGPVTTRYHPKPLSKSTRLAPGWSTLKFNSIAEPKIELLNLFYLKIVRSKNSINLGIFQCYYRRAQSFYLAIYCKRLFKIIFPKRHTNSLSISFYYKYINTIHSIELCVSN